MPNYVLLKTPGLVIFSAKSSSNLDQMKIHSAFYIITLLLLLSFISPEKSYEKMVKKTRKEQEKSFVKREKKANPKGKFDYFHYFDIDQKYRVKAHVQRTPDSEPFKMPTSTSRMAEYKKFAVLTFVIDDKSLNLSVYQSMRLLDNPEYKNYLFLPFKDLTCGDETYGGGRFLEMNEAVVGDSLTLDFNVCYNPYCAYSDRYSCPIPPEENHLDVRIPAGVKGWNDH